MTDTDKRLAELVRLVADGWSIVAACRSLHVSQRTVWKRRRSHPEFQAALVEAEALGQDIRKAERDETISEAYFADALDQADRYNREGTISKKVTTKRQRRLLTKLHGTSAGMFPGCSPSDTWESADPIERLTQRHVRARMRASFEERRKLKSGGLAGNTSQPSQKAPPSAMTSHQQQQFISLVTGGYSVASAARKLGMHKDDVLAHKAANLAFAQALVDAMGEGSDAFSSTRREPAKKAGKAGVLF